MVAILEHHHIIRNLENFLKPMGNVKDRRSLRRQFPYFPEQEFSLARRKHGGGFIKNQHARRQDQGLGDFHNLLNRNRQV